MATQSLKDLSIKWAQDNKVPVTGNEPGGMSVPPAGAMSGYAPATESTTPSTVIPTQVIESGSPDPYTPPEPNGSVPTTAVGVAESYLNDMKAQADAEQAKYDSTANLARQYQQQLLGRSGDYNDLVNQAGIPQANKELNQMLSRIRLGRDELANANDFLNLRIDEAKWDAADRDVTKRGFSSTESRMRSDQLLANSAKAIKLRTQIADADLLQGNISAALDQVNSALSAKYDPIEQALGYEMFWLGQQKDFLTTAQKNAADARMETLRAQQEEINAARDAVNAAVASGGAQPGEIEKMMQMSPQDQMAYANVIMGRTAASDRALDRAYKSSQLNTVIDRGDGMKQLINKQTGEVIATYGEGALEGVAPMTEVERAGKKEFALNMANLANHKGLDSAVGPTWLTRKGPIDAFTGQKDDFIDEVENMLSVLTLMTYAEAKEKGMTFGAMSQGEWDILAASASKIAETRHYKGKGEDKEVIGYDTSEKAFKEELDTLTQFQKRDYVLRGGEPEDVDVQVMSDGTYWVKNSDDTLTELDIKPQ